MPVLDVIKEVESSGSFKSWRKANKDAYLTSAFAMFSPGQKREWLITYFDSKSRTMTTFSGKGSENSNEPFAKEESIPPLKLGEVKTDENSAMKNAMKVLEGEYQEKVQKIVVVLQNLGTTVWNITFMTPAMKVVNVKVSASSGAVIDHNATAISDFMQKK